MDLSGQASQARFASYVEALVEVIGHADRAEPLNDYCVGLLMLGERKSVEPMAAIVAPARVSAKHQSLLHLVGQAPRSDEAVLQKIRELVLPGIERQGRIEAWIVDDTGFTKKGTHSPSCHALYRRLRVLDLGTGRDPPLSLPAAHEASPTRRLSTPRRRRSVPNATSRTRSRRSENASPSRSQNPSRDVHAVSRRSDHLQPDCAYDTVKLGGPKHSSPIARVNHGSLSGRSRWSCVRSGRPTRNVQLANHLVTSLASATSDEVHRPIPLSLKPATILTDRGEGAGHPIIRARPIAESPHESKFGAAGIKI